LHLDLRHHRVTDDPRDQPDDAITGGGRHGRRGCFRGSRQLLGKSRQLRSLDDAVPVVILLRGEAATVGPAADSVVTDAEELADLFQPIAVHPRRLPQLRKALSRRISAFTEPKRHEDSAHAQANSPAATSCGTTASEATSRTVG